MITPIAFQTHGPRDGMKVLFDTNGLSKGPNRMGYDVFIYDSGYYWANECGTEMVITVVINMLRLIKILMMRIKVIGLV